MILTACIPSSTSVVACNDDAIDDATGDYCALYTSRIRRVQLTANTAYNVVIGG